MLQVSSKCNYLLVQKKLEILGNGMLLNWSPINSVKNRNANMILLLVNKL